MRRPRRFVTPLKPSSLSISTSPISPLSPLSPKQATSTPHHPPPLSPRRSKVSASTPPSSNMVTGQPLTAPLPWLWSCHKCHTTYPLGTTRRCLHDGHYFCGSATTDPSTGRIRRHKPCGSEFDYTGWEENRRWRSTLNPPKSAPSTHTEKDCHAQCEYPSACHWKAKEAQNAKAAATKSFDFLDPGFLDVEPEPSQSYIDRFIQAAEKGQNHITTLFSIISEEKNDTAAAESELSRPKSLERSLPRTTSSSDLPVLNGLSLQGGVMDFSTFTTSLKTPSKAVANLDYSGENQDEQLIPCFDSSSAASIDMITDTAMPDRPPSPPLTISPSSLSLSEGDVSPTTIPEFDFELPAPGTPDSSLDASSFGASELGGDGEAKRISPRRNAWVWTEGGFGVELTMLEWDAGILEEEGEVDGVTEREEGIQVWKRGVAEFESEDMGYGVVLSGL